MATSSTPEDRRGAWRWLAREIFGTLFVGALLFGMAGRWDWPGAWLTVLLYGVWVAVNAVLLMPRSPGLLAERAKRQLSPSKTDNVLLGLFGLGVMVKYALAAWEVRQGGSGSLGAGLMLAGLITAAGGYALVTWSMAANAFFSLVVRLQQERGQQVVQNGPYHYMRHPGYLGAILFELGTPLLLGSTWALGVGLFNALVMLLRTAVEDRMLQASLPGYAEYTRTVRWRLIPGIW